MLRSPMNDGTIRTALRRIRGSATRTATVPAAPEADLAGMDGADRKIVERAYPYTMTGALRLEATIQAVRHCVRREIPGAVAECGVWRGGSVLAMILALQELGVDDRDVYLFDTFEGMTEPTEHDVSRHEPPALETWTAAREADSVPWDGLFRPDVFNEDAVRALVLSSGYPEERVHFVRGPVEDTVPGHAPDRLALLRLDTDWYESTRHELEHLYPRLSDGGVLIIDDYGHWEGSRRAVDEYFGQHAAPLLLNRIDYAARIAIKH
jgi:O-methyltransferase